MRRQVRPPVVALNLFHLRSEESPRRRKLRRHPRRAPPHLRAPRSHCRRRRSAWWRRRERAYRHRRPRQASHRLRCARHHPPPAPFPCRRCPHVNREPHRMDRRHMDRRRRRLIVLHLPLSARAFPLPHWGAPPSLDPPRLLPPRRGPSRRYRGLLRFLPHRSRPSRRHRAPWGRRHRLLHRIEARRNRLHRGPPQVRPRRRARQRPGSPPSLRRTPHIPRRRLLRP